MKIISTLNMFFILLQFTSYSIAMQIRTCKLGTLGGYQPRLICTLNSQYILERHSPIMRNDTHQILLLYGSTGNGKTRIAQEFAKCAQAEIHTYSGPAIVNPSKGSGVENIKQMFEKARNSQKQTVIFIENLDAFASDNRYSTIDDYVLAYKQFKIELDTLKDHPHIFVICTTNYIEKIAPDVMSKFSGHICEIKNQNTTGRKNLFNKFFCDNSWTFTAITSVKEYLHKIMLQNYGENANNQLAFINTDFDKLHSLVLSDVVNHEQMITILEKIHKALDEALQNENLTIVNNESFLKEIKRVRTAVQNILLNMKATIKTKALIHEPIFEYLVDATNGMCVAFINKVAIDIHELFTENPSLILDKQTIDRIVAPFIDKKTNKTIVGTFDAPAKPSFIQFLKENPAMIAAMAIVICALVDWRSPYEKIVEAKKKKKEQDNYLLSRKNNV